MIKYIQKENGDIEVYKEGKPFLYIPSELVRNAFIFNREFNLELKRSTYWEIK